LNLSLSEQVSEQRLDLGVAVCAQRPFGLRREDRREEGVGAAADRFDAALVGCDLAVGHGAVVQADRLPLASPVDDVEISLGATLARKPNDDLRAVAASFVRPYEVLDVLRQVDLIVEGEAPWTGSGGTRRHRRVRRHAFHQGALAASVAADDGDELRVAGQTLEVERQFVAAETVANSAEALEGKLERVHGRPC